MTIDSQRADVGWLGIAVREFPKASGPVDYALFVSRDVKSALYFEQMKGCGARTITPTQLSQVTPDADEKTRFVLVDAVGSAESLKHISQPLGVRARQITRKQRWTCELSRRMPSRVASDCTAPRSS